MKEYLPFKQIEFKGAESTDPLSFKYYDANRIVMGKTMEEHLRFSLTYWHTFESLGGDPFGETTRHFEWDSLNPMERARAKVDVMFEYLQKLGVKYFTFHDRDIAPEADTIEEYFKNVEEIVDLLETKMKETGIKLLWNTSNLFSHKRWATGAGTSPNFDIFATACAVVKHNLDIAKKLGAEGFVFWGGREGYESLLNTNMKQEQSQMAQLLHMAKKYALEIGFNGQFLIEPKAKEPMTHQYDYDVATVYSFLKEHGLEKIIKVNLEQNHALLAGHSFQHELRLARDLGILGSLDSNQGNALLGWDTDQFPWSFEESTLAMYEVLKQGSIAPGGLNFDSKLRRQSTDAYDLAYGAILGMDTYAKGLLAAAKLIEEGTLDKFVDERYESWNAELGKKVLDGEATLSEIAAYGMVNQTHKTKSSRQEMLEAVINQAIATAK